MLYPLHDLQRSLFRPVSLWAQAGAEALRAFPLPGMAPLAAGYELLHRMTKDYPRPSFGIREVVAHGRTVSVVEEVVAELPFCRLLRFTRRTEDEVTAAKLGRDFKLLLCAPLSGHFATLLRDTARTLLQDFDVYVTDWKDAREVPLSEGTFHLDTYVAYLQGFMRQLGPSRLHVVAVCQPVVPALAAVSLLASAGERTPRSLVLMGGPVDGQQSPTEVNTLAAQRPLSWFEQNLVHTVPAGHPGAGRRVYPGFLQLTAFVAMNPLRHAEAYRDYFAHRATGKDGAAHERFYDEYNAVLDMDAAYYLETVDVVFQRFLLARGEWDVNGARVRPGDIRDTALLTVEGAEDDISGVGQTQAAHRLCSGLPPEKRAHHLAQGVGHYGIFSGHKWREDIQPRVRDFLKGHEVVEA
jgi:poly(3-hydroxybutyrate) depolymerase